MAMAVEGCLAGGVYLQLKPLEHAPDRMDQKSRRPEKLSCTVSAGHGSCARTRCVQAEIREIA